MMKMSSFFFFLEIYYMLLNYSLDVLGHIFKHIQFTFLQDMKRTGEEKPDFLQHYTQIFGVYVSFSGQIMYILHCGE